MITTRAESGHQAMRADSTRFYAGSGDQLYARVRCARPGCRSATLLTTPPISREIVERSDRSLGCWAIWSWARRQLHRAPLPLGWLRLEWAGRHFDLCSFRCLHGLSEFLT